MTTITIMNKSTGSAIGDRIGCADSPLTRLVGLLGRNTLEDGAGIWIRPSSGVHTFGMRFPIDVLGLDSDMRIVKVWPNVPPNRIPGISRKVKSVVELASGEIAARSIVVGQLLEVKAL